MNFRLVPNSVILSDLERCNGRYFALFQRIRVASGAHCVKVHVRAISSHDEFLYTIRRHCVFPVFQRLVPKSTVTP